jgi:hypothetical protein
MHRLMRSILGRFPLHCDSRGSNSNTQFILVTHNKKPCRLLTFIYGVTMDEGVSQVISLEIDQLPDNVN